MPYRWKYDRSYIDYLNGTSNDEPKLLVEDITYFIVENEYARLKRFADLNVKLLAYPTKKGNINYKVVRKVITNSYCKIEFNIDGNTLFAYIENNEFIIYDLTKTIIERLHLVYFQPMNQFIMIYFMNYIVIIS